MEAILSFSILLYLSQRIEAIIFFSRKISNNFAALGGGGVAIGDSHTTIRNSVISNNQAGTMQGSAFYYSRSLLQVITVPNATALIADSILMVFLI